mgnify:CR=1 FL=1
MSVSYNPDPGNIVKFRNIRMGCWGAGCGEPMSVSYNPDPGNTSRNENPYVSEL